MVGRVVTILHSTWLLVLLVHGGVALSRSLSSFYLSPLSLPRVLITAGTTLAAVSSNNSHAIMAPDSKYIVVV